MFHRTPAYEDGSLCPGDELVAVNGVSLRGYTRKETADVIQSSHVRQEGGGEGRRVGGQERGNSFPVNLSYSFAALLHTQGEITISFNRIEPPKGKNTDIGKCANYTHIYSVDEMVHSCTTQR